MTLLDHFKETPYISVPFLLGRQKIEEAVSAFTHFLDLPDTVKTHIDFTIAPTHRRGDVGFKHRDPNDHLYSDSKDFFHYHPAIYDRHAEFVAAHPVLAHFLEQADSIWQAARDTVEMQLQLLEPQFPGLVDRIFATDHPHFQLRFLKYNWQESGKYLAKPHFDAGSFTLAIAESCPGLRIGTGPTDLELVEHRDGEALFMISSNFQKVLDTDELKPGWHDVIQLDEAIIGKPFARWAVVAFIDGHGVTALSRTETHKYYQPEAA